MVSHQYIGRNHLEFIHPGPRQNGGAKSMSIMCDGAHDYWPEHHWFSPTTATDSKSEERNVRYLHLQDKVPTVRKIRLGRGALMRPRQRAEKEQ